MHLKSNELTLIYNGSRNRDKKTLAYALSIAPKVNKQEVNSVRISSTLFEIFLNKLDLNGKDIINKADPYYQGQLRGQTLSNEEWFSILMNNPHMLKAPLAMYKDRAVQCLSEGDILRLA